MGGLKAQVLMAGCAVTFVLRLRQLVISCCPVGKRSACLAGKESQAPFFLYQEPENLDRFFIDHFDALRAKGAVVQQGIAQTEIEKITARDLQRPGKTGPFVSGRRHLIQSLDVEMTISRSMSARMPARGRRIRATMAVVRLRGTFWKLPGMRSTRRSPLLTPCSRYASMEA